MASIVTVPNDNDPVMNAERARLSAWAPGHGWVFTGYNNEPDHIAQIRRASGGAAIQALDFSCHANPSVFDHTFSSTALQFGRSLAGLPGFSSSSAVYISGCNTGNTSNFVSVAIAQTVADGARCAVYGTKGYMVGTYAEGNEGCWRGDDVPPPTGPLPVYPGAETATGRNVWRAFRPRGFKEDQPTNLRTFTVGIDQVGRIWATFDPTESQDKQMNEANSLTVDTSLKTVRPIVDALEAIMKADAIEFPPYKMAADITINFVDGDNVRIIDVYANGGLLRDRISGKTWRVADPVAFSAAVLQQLR